MNPHNLYFSQTPTIVNPINIIMRSYSAKAANPGSKDEKKGPKHASKKKKNYPKKSSSLAIGNRRTRFLKHRRGDIKGMKGTACQGNRVSFGSYALQALEPAWITSKQIEAGRKSMTRYAHRGGKIWIRIIPDKSVTGKPVEVRMGRGKGAVKYMAAVVKPGRVLYEISGVPENIAKEAITLAGSKMPIRTKFIRA